MNEKVKEGIIVTIVVVILVISVYLMTAIFGTKELGNKTSKKTTTTTFSGVTELYDDMIIASNVFNKSGKYKVIFFSNNDIKDDIKNAIKNYSAEEKLYKVNLDEKINKFIVSEEENSKASNYTELKINKTTLIEIKNGKIISYITTKDDIISELK